MAAGDSLGGGTADDGDDGVRAAWRHIIPVPRPRSNPMPSCLDTPYRLGPGHFGHPGGTAQLRVPGVAVLTKVFARGVSRSDAHAQVLRLMSTKPTHDPPRGTKSSVVQDGTGKTAIVHKAQIHTTYIRAQCPGTCSSLYQMAPPIQHPRQYSRLRFAAGVTS